MVRFSIMDFFNNNQHIAFDGLTQLYDRETIVCYANNLIMANRPFSMALIDVDNFKYINDNYGHIAGDKIICEVSERLKKLIGENGVVGRFGGDEFIAIMPDLINYDEVWQACHKTLVNMSEVEITDFNGLYVTVTIGLARFPENAMNYEKLLETADKALYRGKTKGRNCFIIYLPEKHANIVLKTEKDKQLTSMYLHSIVFNNLTKTDNLTEGIKNLFDFISAYYMIDHICIQSEGNGSEIGKLYFEKIHQLSKTKIFKPMSLELIRSNMNSSIEMFYLNDLKQLVRSNQIEFYNLLCDQKITSTCCVNITYQNTRYGMLRADMTGVAGSNRIWQYGDMDILLTTAKTIALILHYTGKSLSDF